MTIFGEWRFHALTQTRLFISLLHHGLILTKSDTKRSENISNNTQTSSEVSSTVTICVQHQSNRSTEQTAPFCFLISGCDVYADKEKNGNWNNTATCPLLLRGVQGSLGQTLNTHLNPCVREDAQKWKKCCLNWAMRKSVCNYGCHKQYLWH